MGSAKNEPACGDEYTPSSQGIEAGGGIVRRNEENQAAGKTENIQGDYSAKGTRERYQKMQKIRVNGVR